MRPARWEDRLAAEIRAGARRAFAWGDHDCVTFAHRCARAVLGGPTPWDEIAAGWSDRRGAVKALRACGGLVAGMDAHGVRRPVAYARRGDIALLRLGRDGEIADAGRPALAVVDGRALLAPCAVGLRRFAMSDAEMCWGVG